MPEIVDGDESNLYLVESIVDRRVKRGRVEYRVRWKGFPPEQDSWEPFTNIREPCLSLIQDFHHRKVVGEKRYTSVSAASSSSSRSTKSTSRNSAGPSFKFKHESLSKSNKVQTDLKQPAARFSLTTNLNRACSDSTQDTTSTSSDPVTFNSSGLITSPFVVGDVEFRSLSVSTTMPDALDQHLGNVEASQSCPPVTECNHSTTSCMASTTSSKPRRSKPNDSSRLSQSSLSVTSKKVVSSVPKSKSNSTVSKPTASLPIPTTPKEEKPDTVLNNSASSDTNTEPHRKSVTIMLKASPTQEFHNTKDLQFNHSPVQKPPSSKKSSAPTLKQSKPKSPKSTPILSSPSQSVPDSHLAKVMDVVLQLKESRRRPVQAMVFMACQRQYGLSESSVLTALNFLVGSGQLHEIPFTNGISYRCNPRIVARGDLSHPSTNHTWSAKIKAKYVSNLKHKNLQKQAKLSQRELVLSNKHPLRQGFPTSHPSNKRSRSNPCHFDEPHNKKSCSPKTQSSNYCKYGQLGLTALDSKISKFVDSNRIDDPILNVNHIPTNHEDLTSSNKSQCEPRIFVVPPASPLIESNFEMRFKNLPHRLLNKSDVSTDDVWRSGAPLRDSLPSNCIGASSSISALADSVESVPTPRRISIRQTTAAGYKFKSIQVKKNDAGCFTEIWLQSPASPLKNAFTIQVLEELTTILNQAVYDSSRLIMICGIGNVFSSGIDLTLLIGQPVHRSINSSRAPSSTSSLCSCNGGSSTHVPENTAVSFVSANTDSPTNQKESVPPNSVTTGCFHCSSSVNPISDMSRKFPDQFGVSSQFTDPDPTICQQLCAALRAFLLALVAFPKPIVAGVNGPAMGLAVSILPLCDLVYASDVASFQLPYTRLGQTPEGGSSFTLGALIGLPLANELLLAGRKLSAREAAQRGFVSDLLYPKSFKEELIMRCQRIASASSSALEMTKCIVRTQQRDRIEFVINTECRKLVELWQTDEFRKSAINFLSHGMEDFI